MAIELTTETNWFVQVVAVLVPVAAVANTFVVPFTPCARACVVVFTAIKPSAVGAAPAALGNLNPAVTETALKSKMPEAPRVKVWVV